MAAPLGNQYYKIALANNNLNGRPATFDSEETVMIRFKEYIEYMETKTITKVDFVKSGPTAGQLVEIPCRVPYTIESFCLFCGITYVRFTQIINDEKCKDLFNVLSYVRDTIRNDQIEGGLVGTLNPMLVARIQGLKEQQEVSGEIKNTIQSITFVQHTVESAEAEIIEDSQQTISQ